MLLLLTVITALVLAFILVPWFLCCWGCGLHIAPECQVGVITVTAPVVTFDCANGCTGVTALFVVPRCPKTRFILPDLTTKMVSLRGFRQRL
jgi:hypothetical protein